VTLQNVGQTTNFSVSFDDALVSAQPPANQAQTRANLTANCNALLGQVETAFTTTTGWPSILLTMSDRMRAAISVTPPAVDPL